MGSRVLTCFCLVVYAWIVHVVGWSKLVMATWGFQNLFLVDDLAILSPFIVMQLFLWAGLFFSERALHDSRLYPRLPVYLWLKARQSVGLILPVVLIFIVRQDLFARFWPEWHRSSLAEPVELAGAGVLDPAGFAALRPAGVAHSLVAGWTAAPPAGARSAVALAFGSPIFWSGTPGRSWSTPVSPASCPGFATCS